MRPERFLTTCPENTTSELSCMAWRAVSLSFQRGKDDPSSRLSSRSSSSSSSASIFFIVFLSLVFSGRFRRSAVNHRLMPTARKCLSCKRASIARRRHSRSVRRTHHHPSQQIHDFALPVPSMNQPHRQFIGL